MIIGAGYVDADDHLAELELVNDAEVIFNFRLVADNGLTFGAKVEFEANGRSENADEYVGSVQGDFGRLEVGREDGAGDRLLLTPPGCNLSCSGNGDGFLFDYAEGGAGDAINNDGNDTDDDIKVTYFTPSLEFAMVKAQAGASYTPGDDTDGNTSNIGESRSAIAQEGYEFGFRVDFDLSETMGVPDVELAVSGSYFDLFNERGAGDSFALAAEFDAFGFGVGARYHDATLNDEQSVSFGLEYGAGPWYVGGNVTMQLEGDVRSDDDTAASFEVNYALAPGVTAAGIVEFADYDFVDPAAPDGGFAIGALLSLDF